MGVHGTYCQLCGLPTQHDHYVPTATGMLKIYRGAREDGGHRWEADERPFPFRAEHAWLKDAVVLPWDADRVLRGPIEDGAIDDDGDSILVWEGGEDGLAFHHTCWELQGSPGSTGAAVRANQSHGWALVEAYQEQLFEFSELAGDGKAWMLADPATDARSRARIDAMLGVAQRAVTEAPRTIEEVLAIDCDWTCKAVRDDTYERKSLVRARMYTLEKVPKTGYGALVRIVRPCGGPAEIDALERFEIELKSAVERDGRAILAAIGIGEARAEYLVYARDAATTKTQVPGSAQVDSVDDPSWAQALALIRSLG